MLLLWWGLLALAGDKAGEECPRLSHHGGRLLRRYDTPNVTYAESYRWIEDSIIHPPTELSVPSQSYLWRKQRLFDQFVQHADQAST